MYVSSNYSVLEKEVLGVKASDPSYDASWKPMVRKVNRIGHI